MNRHFSGKKKLLSLLFTLIVLGISAYITSQEKPYIIPSAPSPTPTITSSVLSVKDKQVVTVTKVVDGDTIEVTGGLKVRLIGIDTPETVDPRRGVQCFGKEASNRTKELLLNQQIVMVKDISETDKYGRLLRYIFLAKDNTFINEQLVREGFAHASSYPPDIQFQTLFKAAEKDASESNRGFWGDATCAPTPTTPLRTDFTCSGKTLCSQMNSCDEATYYLKNCNIKSLDSNNDGIPCDSLCK